MNRVYDINPTLVDYMNRFNEKDLYWMTIANDFVLKVKENPRVASFVETVHSAKIEIEREMRKELDLKIMSMGVCRVYHALGGDLVKRLRSYIKMWSAKNPRTIALSKSSAKKSMAPLPVTRSKASLRPLLVKPYEPKSARKNKGISVSDKTTVALAAA